MPAEPRGRGCWQAPLRLPDIPSTTRPAYGQQFTSSGHPEKAGEPQCPLSTGRLQFPKLVGQVSFTGDSWQQHAGQPLTAPKSETQIRRCEAESSPTHSITASFPASSKVLAFPNNTGLCWTQTQDTAWTSLQRGGSGARPPTRGHFRNKLQEREMRHTRAAQQENKHGG